MNIREHIKNRALEEISKVAILCGDFDDPPPCDVTGKDYQDLTEEEKQAYFARSRFNGLDNSVEGVAYGGSDMAVIHGASPWKSPLELYHFKRSRVPEKISSKQDLLFKAGHALEDAYRLMFEQKTGLITIPFNYQFRSKRWKHFLFNLDGIIYDAEKDEIGIYEGKTTEIWDSHNDDYNEGIIPRYYRFQIDAYLAGTNLNWAYINDGWGARHHHMAHAYHKHDRVFTSQIMDIAEDFIDDTITGIPPDNMNIANPETAEKALALMYGPPKEKGSKQKLDKSFKKNLDSIITLDEEIIEYRKNEFNPRKKHLEDMKEQRQMAVNVILNELKDNEEGILKLKDVVYYINNKGAGRYGIDQEMLHDKYPDVYSEVYRKKPTKKRKFNIHKIEGA